MQENVPLSPLTSFRIGGAARFYVKVRTESELLEAVKWAKDKSLAFCVLGGGSNVVVNDEGFDGLVIHMKISRIERDENSLVVGAGVSLMHLVNTAAEFGLSGMENLAGIPGTVGGAVRGNAGAYGTEICQLLTATRVLDTDMMEFAIVENADCHFEYRSSVFKRDPRLIVVSTTLSLQSGDPQQIAAKSKEIVALRIAKGLSGIKSAGSFFMNPKIDDENFKEMFERDKGVPLKGDRLPAGWVIDQVGLRGKKIGGAAMSDVHANYLINIGEATASDVAALSSLVKQQVRDTLGIQLQEEVSYIGF